MKIFLLLVLIFANYSAYATEPDIAPDATTISCDSDVLNSDNGPVDIEINWEPNVIPLRWYSGNTEIHPENTNANSCTYDSVLNRPTNPTREGYNFAGWRVRPTMDFSTIPTNQPGVEYWAKGWAATGDNKCWNASGAVGCSTDIKYIELQTHEWKVKFEHGDLYGMGGCSTEGEGLSGGTAGNPTIDNNVGTHCWCKATGYKPNNYDTVYGPSSTLYWIFRNNHDSAGSCLWRCAGNCASYTKKYYYLILSRLFTPIQQ